MCCIYILNIFTEYISKQLTDENIGFGISNTCKWCIILDSKHRPIEEIRRKYYLASSTDSYKWRGTLCWCIAWSNIHSLSIIQGKAQWIQCTQLKCLSFHILKTLSACLAMENTKLNASSLTNWNKESHKISLHIPHWEPLQLALLQCHLQAHAAQLFRQGCDMCP